MQTEASDKNRLYFFILALLIASIPALILIKNIYNPYFSFIGDEYQFYTDAKNIAEKGISPWRLFSQSGVYGYHPVLDSFYQAAWMKLLPNAFLAWKLSTIAIVIFSSLLTMYISYLLFADKQGALISGLFFIFSHYILGFAHIPYNNLHAFIPFLLAVVWMLLYEHTSKIRYGFLAGIATGLSFYTFFSARLIIAIILPWLIYKRKAVISVMSGFLLFFLPFVLINGQSIITRMLDQTFFQIAQGDTSWYMKLFDFIASTLIPQHLITHHYVIGPLLNPILLIAGIMGFALLMKKKKSTYTRRFLLVYWFAMVSILVVLTYSSPNYNVPITRLHIIVPSICIAAAFAIRFIGRKHAYIYLLIPVVLISELILFFHVLPHRHGHTRETLLLEYAINNQDTLICFNDFELREMTVLSDIYALDNLLAQNSSQPSIDCDRVVSFETDTFYLPDWNTETVVDDAGLTSLHIYTKQQ